METLTLTTGNMVKGEIYFSTENGIFPEEGWNDFVVVVLTWWYDSFKKMIDANKNEIEQEFYFMDGPFMIKALKDFYKGARHPYTKALLSAIPLPDPILEKKREQIVLEGELPSPVHPPMGCVFHTRCPIAQDSCKKQVPLLEDTEKEGHAVACFYPE